MSEEMKDIEATEDVEAATTDKEQDNGDDPEREEHQEKKYTDEDVNKIVAKKIKRERERLRKAFDDEQQENELEKRERDVLKRELRADAKDMLVDEGLPNTLANLMDYEDKEAFDKSYEEVTRIFREAVQRGIKDALKGEAPKIGSGGGHDPIAEAFKARQGWIDGN